MNAIYVTLITLCVICGCFAAVEKPTIQVVKSETDLKITCQSATAGVSYTFTRDEEDVKNVDKEVTVTGEGVTIEVHSEMMYTGAYRCTATKGEESAESPPLVVGCLLSSANMVTPAILIPICLLFTFMMKL